VGVAAESAENIAIENICHPRILPRARDGVAGSHFPITNH